MRMRQLLDRLRAANLKLKPSKCRLLQREVIFLGHKISAGRIDTDPEKIQQIETWPRPRNVQEVRSFVGLASYYRRFIRQFAEVASPLHALTKKHARFEWSTACDDAFNELKRRLISHPVLAMPSDEGEFRLDTDASYSAIGAVLSQVQDGEERVIAYASRTLSQPEQNYCVTRKELLAVVHFVKQFRPYILGREFLLRTDHSALRWLKLTPEPIGQQARWLERLEEFNFRIEHRPGKQHANADAMSRRPCRQCRQTGESEVSEVSARLIQMRDDTAEAGPNAEVWDRDYEQDSQLREVFREIAGGGEGPGTAEFLGSSREQKTYWLQRERLRVLDGRLYREWYSTDGRPASLQLVPPKGRRQELLAEIHGGITGGHLGVRKTQEQVQRRAYWVGWRQDVRRFCQTCAECSRYERGKLKKQGPLQPTAVGEPFERIAIDLTGPHPKSRSGNMYILTMVDLFSKWAEGIPLRNKEAVTVARALFDVVICRYGFPLQILSDNGKEFESGVLRELCRLTNIDKIRTTAYKPSTNGAVERFHRTLNSMLGKVVAEHQRDWDERLPAVMAAYRSSAHEATGFSPNYILFGRETTAPADLLYGAPPEPRQGAGTMDEFAERKIDMMRAAYDLVRRNLKTGANRMKKNYDMRVKPARFTVGMWVLYYNPRRYQGRSPKWQRLYTGPFLITRMLDPVNAVLQRGRKAKPFVSHVDKLKACHGETPESWLRSQENGVADRELMKGDGDASLECEIGHGRSSDEEDIVEEGRGISSEALTAVDSWAGELPYVPARTSGRTVRRPVRWIESC